MTNKRFYITTPIYYPSSVLHLGHAYTTTIADAFARYKKSQGYEVFFLTGSDEHGQKIAKKAAENYLEPKQFVDKIVLEFKDLWKQLNINFSYFVRTTDLNHKKTVQKIFSKLLASGDIYLSKYEGWYCVSCEEFITDSQIDKITQTCKNCNQKLITLSEPSYFLKISKYQNWLIKYYEQHENFLWPVQRKYEMINTFIKDGLSDLSVSRTSFNWGIPILEDESHVIYVWIDALSNYLSALGYLQDQDENFKKFWLDQDCEIVQLVGKEITRFHAIYWPVLLKCLSLRQPNTILSHGWIVNDKGKMAKSKGNVIDPRILIKRYSADAVRCFLLKEINFGADGKYSHEAFCNFFNSYLVNDLGNLLSRITSMIIKYNNGLIPNCDINTLSANQKILFNSFVETDKNYHNEMNSYQITNSVNIVWKLINILNKNIEEVKPWLLNINQNYTELHNYLNIWANGMLLISNLLAPILTESCQEIQKQLGLVDQYIFYHKFISLNNINSFKINKSKLLFLRLNIEKEVSFLSNC